jgi:hypothetical protein
VHHRPNVGDHAIAAKATAAQKHHPLQCIAPHPCPGSRLWNAQLGDDWHTIQGRKSANSHLANICSLLPAHCHDQELLQGGRPPPPTSPALPPHPYAQGTAAERAPHPLCSRNARHFFTNWAALSPQSSKTGTFVLLPTSKQQVDPTLHASPLRTHTP